MPKKTKLIDSISVFCPAYNEEENIAEFVNKTNKFLAKYAADYEIIVVDDGSRDQTAEIVKKLMKKNKRLRLAQHKKNKGYGGALKTGITSATKEWIFYTDADNQFNIAEIKKLIPLTRSAEIVSGYRVKRKDHWSRLVAAKIYNITLKFLFRIPIRDVDCAFKIYHRHIFQNIKIKSIKGFVDAEIIIKAKNLGHRVVETGVSHYPRTKGETKYEVGNKKGFFTFGDPGEALRVYREIWRLWPELKPKRPKSQRFLGEKNEDL